MATLIKGTVIICSSPNGRGIAKYAEYLKDLMDGELITCDKKTKRFVLWELFGILSYLRVLRRARLVIFSNTRVSPLLWMFLDWRKVVVVVHDLMDTDAEKWRSRGSRYEERKGLVVRKINSWVMSNSIKKASSLIFNSQYTESEVRRWIGTRCTRSVVVSPPPSLETLVGGRESKENNKKIRNVCKVLAVTGTSKNKAHERYMAFHGELETRLLKKVELIIYGIDLNRARRDFADWVVNQRDRVTVKYRREEEELLEDYLDCDFLVSLSKEEGYGMPVADALGFGVPVVAMAIESYREIRRTLDNQGIMYLGDNVSRCVEEAASLVSSSTVEERREKRLESYRQFCNRSRIIASTVLKDLGLRH